MEITPPPSKCVMPRGMLCSIILVYGILTTYSTKKCIKITCNDDHTYASMLRYVV